MINRKFIISPWTGGEVRMENSIKFCIMRNIAKK